MKLQPFKEIQQQATERKGGKKQLASLLPMPLSEKHLMALGDDRYLSAMAQCINQAGFSWKVIENKWPQFEEAFLGFDIKKLILLPDEKWEAYTQDKRVVRNWQKIKAVKDNLAFVYQIQRQHGSFGQWIADWPCQDQIGLLKTLKKEGSRLGGNTGQWFLRYVGKDGFVLTKDVCAALIRANVDIKPAPTSQAEFKRIQAAFNVWHEETGLPYSHLSRIAAFSIGENYPNV
ncbi:MAG: DNA-3-methyladenine glycosylase I [Pseudomonadales bacterium]|nr:DNA-3-methyladenine glycosylase I [Pseudomonadales bacterium]